MFNEYIFPLLLLNLYLKKKNLVLTEVFIVDRDKMAPLRHSNVKTIINTIKKV